MFPAVFVALALWLGGGTTAAGDGQHDFDFEIGTWKTHLSRRLHPLTGSTTWVDYEGTSVVRPVWNGRANLLELVADGPAGHLEGLSLRLYNPQSHQWSLNFSNVNGGTLSPPTIGGFKDGRGEFFSRETLDGRAIDVRFVISDITAHSCRFEQAFSDDGGKTWEVNWIATDTRAPSWPLVELRQYTLRPGQRDVLIELFEREFIESQEALGMKILGTFRDLDRPDHFVWIRGFSDMASRAQGLGAFYGGPVWQAHRSAANATMLDSDNVLLLRAARPGSGLAPADRPRPARGATEIPKGLVIANVYSFPAPVGPEFLDFFERVVAPELQAAGMAVRGAYLSETSPNNFPRLPIRENEPVFVWFSAFADPSDYQRCLDRLARSAGWPAAARALQQKLKGPPEVLRLQPTPRSAPLA